MKKCRTGPESFKTEKEGKTNRLILNGYWIWWCYEHNQPLAWCEIDALKAALKVHREVGDEAENELLQLQSKSAKMKNADIVKIRQLLNERIAVAKVSADNENYLIKFSIRDAESILAILPCEICDDSGRVPTFDQASGLADADPCPDCQQNEELKNVPHPICPINMYFEGDEDKCDVRFCDFQAEGSRSCTQACIVDVEELQKEIDKIKPGCTKGELRVLSDSLTIKAKKVEYTPHYDAEPPQTFVAKCFQNGHLGRTKRPTKEDLANAKELVRRWNAFEKNGLVPDLLTAAKIGLSVMLGISRIATGLDIVNTEGTNRHAKRVERVKAAIAKAMSETTI